MRRGVFISLILLILILLPGPSALFGWGENAERLIINKAVDTLPDEMLPFFQANRQYLVQHVTDVEEPNAKKQLHSDRSLRSVSILGAPAFV